MALVNQVNKKVKMTQWEVIKFQLLTYCYLKGIQMSDADLECLTCLALHKEIDLPHLCSIVQGMGIFKSTQAARNSIRKVEIKGLVLKQGKNKKKIIINPDVNIVTTGNILLNYNFLGLETA